MEVKTGYKQTDVGVIPDDWEVKSMDSLTSLMTNGFVGTATSAYVNGDDGVLYIQGYNVQENGFDFHGVKRVSRSFHARNQKSCLREGDLLTIQTGDIGVTTIVPPELVGANCHALVISRFIKETSDPRFYCHYFNSERGRAKFKEIETGSTMKHLNVGDMKPLFLPSPPVEEQRAIAEALNDVDRLLDGLDRLIAKKRDLKQAAMQQLLTGQTRLPGFHGEWVKKSLGHLIEEIGDGATPSTADRRNFGGEINWVVIDDIKDEITTTGTTLTERGLKSCAAKLWNPGTLIVSTGATIGEVGIARIPVATKQGICGLVVDEAEATAEFLKYWFVQNRSALLAKAQGSTIKEVRAPTLVKFELPTPSPAEQSSISAVLTDMDTELAALIMRRDKARALKEGMMQELLTGRTRLVPATSAYA